MLTDLYGFQPNPVVRTFSNESRDMVVNEPSDCFAADSRQYAQIDKLVRSKLVKRRQMGVILGNNCGVIEV